MRLTLSRLALSFLLLSCFNFVGAASRRVAASAPQAAAPSDKNDKLTAELVAAEKEFWEAWKNKQPERFARAMSGDAVFFGIYGVTGRSELLGEQNDSTQTCHVKSYSLTNLRSIPIDRDAAILLYDAEQHATCGDQPVTPFMHGESVYARRHGRWINILRSEVPAANQPSPQP